MKLDKFFQLLTPKDKKFYPMFCEASDNLVKCSLVFRELLNCTDENTKMEYVVNIKKLEKVGDRITTSIFDELNSVFITPFDREDIQQLANRIDNVVDILNACAKRLQLYRLPEIPPVFLEMADLVVKAAHEINEVTLGLNNLHTINRFKVNCETIGRLENESDALNYSFLAEIFDTETNAITLLKKRDILNSLEKAMDYSEDVADVFQTIIVKHA